MGRKLIRYISPCLRRSSIHNSLTNSEGLPIKDGSSGSIDHRHKDTKHHSLISKEEEWSCFCSGPLPNPQSQAAKILVPTHILAVNGCSLPLPSFEQQQQRSITSSSTTKQPPNNPSLHLAHLLVLITSPPMLPTRRANGSTSSYHSPKNASSSFTTSSGSSNHLSRGSRD